LGHSLRATSLVALEQELSLESMVLEQELFECAPCERPVAMVLAQAEDNDFLELAPCEMLDVFEVAPCEMNPDMLALGHSFQARSLLALEQELRLEAEAFEAEIQESSSQSTSEQALPDLDDLPCEMCPDLLALGHSLRATSLVALEQELSLESMVLEQEVFECALCERPVATNLAQAEEKDFLELAPCGMVALEQELQLEAEALEAEIQESSPQSTSEQVLQQTPDSESEAEMLRAEALMAFVSFEDDISALRSQALQLCERVLSCEAALVQESVDQALRKTFEITAEEREAIAAKECFNAIHNRDVVVERSALEVEAEACRRQVESNLRRFELAAQGLSEEPAAPTSPSRSPVKNTRRMINCQSELLASPKAARPQSPAGVAGRLRPQLREAVMAFRMDLDDDEEQEQQPKQLKRVPSITNMYESLGAAAVHNMDEGATTWRMQTPLFEAPRSPAATSRSRSKGSVLAQQDQPSSLRRSSSLGALRSSRGRPLAALDSAPEGRSRGARPLFH